MFPWHAYRLRFSEVKSNEEKTIPPEDYWNTSEDIPRIFQNFDAKSYQDFKTCSKDFQRFLKTTWRFPKNLQVDRKSATLVEIEQFHGDEDFRSNQRLPKCPEDHP